MGDVFLKIFNMSITAGWLTVAVILLRFCLKKAPKWIHCLLWAAVALRLILPFSLESALSLIPSTETLSTTTSTGIPFEVQTGMSTIDNSVNDYLGSRYYEGITVPANNFFDILSVVTVIWLIGIVIMLVYSAFSYIRLRKRVEISLIYRNNIYYCDNIDSPFILGIIKPRIYLPSGLCDQQTDYVIKHESAHLLRHDHWWKPLGFLLLAVYWFNPVIWVAYILLCRDIERACDEKVIKDMEAADKKGYSEALVSCSVNRRTILACPLAFGEVSVKNRIKAVLHYKKPTVWIIFDALIAIIILSICFLTNPKTEKWQSENRGIVSTVCAAECDNVIYTFLHGAVDSDEPHIEVEWTNNTDDNLCFGDRFIIYKDGKIHEPTEEIGWHLLLHSIKQGEALKESMSLFGYEFENGNSYRLEKEFYLESNPDKKYKAFIEFTVDRRYSFAGAEYRGEKIIYEASEYSSILYTDSTIPYFTVNDVNFHLITTDLPDRSTNIIYDVGQLKKIELKKDNFDDLFSDSEWENSSYTAKSLRKNNLNAFYVFDIKYKKTYYLLEQKNGDIFIAQGDSSRNNIRYVFKMKLQDSNDNLIFNPYTTYTYEKSADRLAQQLNLDYSTNHFTFSWSSFSSYFAYGSFEIKNNTLTCNTDDGLYTLIFRQENDTFIFDKQRSTVLPEYRYSADAEPQSPLPDGAVFEPYMK